MKMTRLLLGLLAVISAGSGMVLAQKPATNAPVAATAPASTNALPSFTAAKVKLKSGITWNVELLGTGQGLLQMRQIGQETQVGVGVKDIAEIEFARLKTNETAIIEAYNLTDYKRAVELLRPLMKPLFPYLAFQSNGAEPMAMLLKSMYMEGEYRDVEVWAVFLARVPDPKLNAQAGLLRILARIGQGFHDSAEKELNSMGKVDPKNEANALYYYARAAIALARKNWRETQMNAAQVLIFQPKNLEWLPPILYTSAQGYAGAGRAGVAVQIASEITTMSPDTRWARLVAEALPGWQAQAAKETKPADKAEPAPADKPEPAPVDKGEPAPAGKAEPAPAEKDEPAKEEK
jgi:hypothetical protein